LPHLDNEFLKVARGKARSQEISYFAGWPQAKFGSFFSVNNCQYTYLIKLGGGGKKKPPISEHVLIIKHFLTLFSFINHIRQFLCPWTHQLESYTCLLSIINKGATQKTL
jgi:hypothetical protein